ncbi:MAG TPA: DUF885 family protein, partial [Longimicrobiales bacterium]|nr:DUF885 family protein [Longimicrobiales bacterium]
MKAASLAVIAFLMAVTTVRAQASGAADARTAADPAVPTLAHLTGPEETDMARVVERFREDDGALRRRYDAPWSAEARDRMRRFYTGWRDELRALDFDALDAGSRIDWLLLDYELRYRLSEADRMDGLFDEMTPLVPFAADLVALHEARRRMEPVDGRETAALLAAIPERVADARSSLDAALAGDDAPSRVVGLRAAQALSATRRSLDRWYGFHAGYDPMFTWWVAEPYEAAVASLEAYEEHL